MLIASKRPAYIRQGPANIFIVPDALVLVVNITLVTIW